jgi:hypothetical protein
MGEFLPDIELTIETLQKDTIRRTISNVEGSKTYGYEFRFQHRITCCVSENFDSDLLK